MYAQRIAIPSNNPGGMEATRSDHFGHCDVFTIVEVKDDKVIGVDNLANNGHSAGGCMVPVKMLADSKVNALVVGGIGQRPLQGFQECGIEVLFADRGKYADVESVVNAAVQGLLPVMRMDGACQGHSQCHTV